MPISHPLSKEDTRRLRKLEHALADLRGGGSTYFSITKLTSIKSLCKDKYRRNEYCAYLSSLVTNNPHKVGENENAKEVNNLIQQAQRVISAVTNNNKDMKSIAEETLSQIRNCQDEYRKVKWTMVRIIRNRDLLILENILEALLSKTDMALAYVYDATRNYVERYSPHYGTGLIVDSIPMLEDIIRFWKRYEDV
jgi:preprotein translocase subunit SecE